MSKHKDAAKSAAYREFKERMKITPIIQHKPFVVGYLVKLGVQEEHAKTFMVNRAYEILYRLLGAKIGKRKCADIKPLYWLWTHGIPPDALASITEEEAMKLLEMIWERIAAKSQAPAGAAA